MLTHAQTQAFTCFILLFFYKYDLEFDYYFIKTGTILKPLQLCEA